MITFPELTSSPTTDSFGHQSLIDPVHRREFESGAILTRTRFRAVPKKWNVVYGAMINVDKETLEVWERTAIGKQFEWINPKDSKTYVSVLGKNIQYSLHSNSSGYNPVWVVTLEIITLSEVA